MHNENASIILDAEGKQESQKVLMKRRSSVFRTVTLDVEKDDRQDLYDTKTESSLNDSDRKESKLDMDVNKEDFDLQKYINNLETERKIWQETLKVRKSERSILKKQKCNMEREEHSTNYNILLDSERSFLLSRPNYEYIHRNSQKLLNVAIKVGMLNRLIYKLDQKFMLRMNEKVSTSVKRVINMSDQ